MNKAIGSAEVNNGSAQKYEVSRGKATTLLIILTLLYTLAYMDRSVIAVVMEQIKIELGLTDAQTGMFQTIFMLGVGVMMIPCGMIVDRWSRRKAVSVMAIVWSGATMFTGAMSSFFLILVGRFATSAGEAGFAPGGTAWISLTFRKEIRAKVLGVFSLGVPFGGAMGVVLGGHRFSFLPFPGSSWGLRCSLCRTMSPPKPNPARGVGGSSPTLLKCSRSAA